MITPKPARPMAKRPRVEGSGILTHANSTTPECNANSATDPPDWAIISKFDELVVHAASVCRHQ